MTELEWESVCDGCAKCCMQQLQDTETDQLVFTDVVCDLLNTDSCRCSDYSNRSQRVPSCMSMNKENVQQCAEFAPPSCSYRLLLEGKSLPEWHHLITNDTQSVHSANASVRGKVRHASTIESDELEDYVVSWPLNDSSTRSAQ